MALKAQHEEIKGQKYPAINIPDKPVQKDEQSHAEYKSYMNDVAAYKDAKAKAKAQE